MVCVSLSKQLHVMVPVYGMTTAGLCIFTKEVILDV